ncbi:2-amino-4-hydroxy-6-hydroxymethyldihydropteridine diphosphokinase [Desmospora profundinema]|uniref:2-amino-4-hydroxy-6-hydroxymethyldihydropteridine diphosphokinase n=1 Tax=Desmospora profundinema TaxID=1571184 RepID=A0ABU1ITI0_9BACL|nr:2-amino-4-hydroxy-6-hydroxymethyldihydropteridine diphosphokinase [Desmospora profundinema]MDR6227080.1 2-amino-4-hydroxy-6-hydroxymethyldihydropteridine diphosphokinase [Desmospora profundinema]
MTRAFIGLGTNLGERTANLKEALTRLDRQEGIRVVRVSRIYETKPVGLLEQPDFLNRCAEVETSLSPAELLAAMLRVERDLHRVRTIRWGPRTIDLDLLLMGDQVIREPSLTVPHPRMTERAFVLIPLKEIASDVVIPPTGRTVGQWAEEVPDRDHVRPISCDGQTEKNDSRRGGVIP